MKMFEGTEASEAAGSGSVSISGALEAFLGRLVACDVDLMRAETISSFIWRDLRDATLVDLTRSVEGEMADVAFSSIRGSLTALEVGATPVQGATVEETFSSIGAFTATFEFFDGSGANLMLEEAFSSTGVLVAAFGGFTDFLDSLGSLTNSDASAGVGECVTFGEK